MNVPTQHPYLENVAHTAMTQVAWGDAMIADMGGTTAQADGHDDARYTLGQMLTYPEVSPLALSLVTLSAPGTDVAPQPNFTVFVLVAVAIAAFAFIMWRR